MKLCPHCGAQVEDEARFCMHCMTDITPKTVIKPRRFSSARKRVAIALSVCAALVAVALPLSFLLRTERGGRMALTADYSRLVPAIRGVVVNAPEGGAEQTPQQQTAASQQTPVIGFQPSGTAESSAPVIQLAPSTSEQTSSPAPKTVTDAPATETGGSPAATTGTQTEQTGAERKDDGDTDTVKTPADETPATVTDPAPTDTGATDTGATDAADPVTEPETPPKKEHTAVRYSYREAEPRDTRVDGITSGTFTIPEGSIIITDVITEAEDGVYIVPSTIDGKTVFSIDAFAFNGVRDSAKVIVLPSCLEAVAKSALGSYTYVTDIYFYGSTFIAPTALPATNGCKGGRITLHCCGDSKSNPRYYKDTAGMYYGCNYAVWNGAVDF